MQNSLPKTFAVRNLPLAPLRGEDCFYSRLSSNSNRTQTDKSCARGMSAPDTETTEIQEKAEKIAMNVTRSATGKTDMVRLLHATFSIERNLITLTGLWW